MTNQQIETLIQRAEKRVSSGSFVGARIAGTVSVLLMPCVFVPEAGAFVAIFAAISSLTTIAFWSDGRAEKRDLVQNHARAVWQAIEQDGALGMNDSGRAQRLSHDVARIYERDPRGETLPLSQAVRLVLAWKQQTQRLGLVTRHLAELRSVRSTLIEKQKQLRDLGDDNQQLDRTLAQLNEDIGPLEQNNESLKASCARLEAILVSVDAATRRRQLHREVGELSGRSPAPLPDTDASDLNDLERQITREIETFLALERETDAHLREL